MEELVEADRLVVSALLGRHFAAEEVVDEGDVRQRDGQTEAEPDDTDHQGLIRGHRVGDGEAALWVRL